MNDDAPWKTIGAVTGICLLLIIPLFLLDKAEHREYNDLHQHMCFERLVKEPWEVEPLGRIEQVGIKRVLVTMGRDRKPVAALDAYVYAFSLPKEEFNREYKEVPCLSLKP